MALHNNRHLTTEQLSALLDKQLSSQEQTEYDAHMQTCPQCQSTLVDLQQTVRLLHALPQPALPRSFVLPVGVTPLQARPVHQVRTVPQIPQRQHVWQSYMRNSVRVLSAIAAVIGLVFILSSALVILPHGGGASSSTTSAPGGTAPHIVTPHITNPGTTCDRNHAVPSGACSTPTLQPQRTPSATNPPNQNRQALNLNTPGGYLGLGSILLLLGILGVVLTRRRPRRE